MTIGGKQEFLTMKLTVIGSPAKLAEFLPSDVFRV